jgi:hypothetical protein
MTHSVTQEKKDEFEAESRETLVRLRSVLAEFLASLSGRVAKTADLRKALKLDHKLSWKIIRIATASDPLAEAIHVPSPANFKTLLKAAAKYKVPVNHVNSLARIAAEFDELVARHAGDRATFDSMVITYGDEDGAISPAYRKMACCLRSSAWATWSSPAPSPGRARPAASSPGPASAR